MAAAPDAIELKDLVEDLVPAPDGFYTCNRTSVLHLVTQRSAFKGLLGLEYIVEIYDGTTTLRYICRLCDTEEHRNEILQHIVAPTHREKYLEEHFPKVCGNMQPYLRSSIPSIGHGIVDVVSKRIDQICGRLRPYSLSAALADQLVAQLGPVDEIRHQDESDYNDVRCFNWHRFIERLPVCTPQNMPLLFPGTE